MNVDFEYNRQWMPQNSLNIKEVGRCAIEAENDDGEFFYLVVDTLLGESMVATCGPVVPDIWELPNGFVCSIERLPYKEAQLVKRISAWLNDKYRAITQAKEIPIVDALGQFRDPQAYLLQCVDTDQEDQDGNAD